MLSSKWVRHREDDKYIENPVLNSNREGKSTMGISKVKPSLSKRDSLKWNLKSLLHLLIYFSKRLRIQSEIWMNTRLLWKWKVESICNFASQHTSQTIYSDDPCVSHIHYTLCNGLPSCLVCRFCMYNNISIQSVLFHVSILFYRPIQYSAHHIYILLKTFQHLSKID